MSLIYNIVISPIELVVEILFVSLFNIIGNYGFSLLGVSVLISLLTLPLYRRADAIQKESRKKQEEMAPWLNHIKRTFKGDERFMMNQAYYRISGYNPIYSLKSAVPLLLQIPFFTAAYHFLSHLASLNGVSFFIISDLGKSDALLHFGAVSINVLPVLMTLINCISASIYLKGFPLKDKLQTYAMALIFLALLYNSPAGLVVYWTCNNVFSLVKNVFYRFKNPRKIASILCAVIGTIAVIALFCSGKLNSIKKKAVVALMEIIILLPLLLSRKSKSNEFSDEAQNSSMLYAFLAGAFLSVLTGVLIPSAVIKSSPAEFVDLQNYVTPLHFLLHSASYAVGFFIFWALIIRAMLYKKAQHIFDALLFSLAGVFLINYLFFGKNMGVLSPFLAYENFGDVQETLSKKAQMINLFICFLIGSALYTAFRFKKAAAFAVAVLLISESILSAANIFKTQRLLSNMDYIKNYKSDEKAKNEQKLFSLSKNGKNVIVFMLDRAISGYIPYLFEEKSILKEQFAGFTYYPNTISHGFCTNYGTPGLFGGYEYTPAEMNKRDTELLKDKQNEALKVLPVLFSENDFDVTVCDPPYANYKWVPDLSIFDEYPKINKYITRGVIGRDELALDIDENALDHNNRNFFCYSIFRALPQFFSSVFYDSGNYLSAAPAYPFKSFTDEYAVLRKLSALTDIRGDKSNTYLSIVNSSTHNPVELQLPDYELSLNVNNAGLKTAADGKIAMENEQQIIHYHANMASLLALGKWFDFMRENGVWDNTRIIIVADHGRGLAQFDYMLMKNPKIDVEWCNPLLMVKDFGAKEFSVNGEFMTNADVPTLATRGVIENPVNPFTKKPLNNAEKTAHPQVITSSGHWDTLKNNGTVFDTSDGHWFSVHDDIFDEANWSLAE